MYDELIERLRNCLTEVNCTGCDCNNSLIKQAADAIDELSHMQIAPEKIIQTMWIPVTERLPEEEESVLVVRKFLGLKGQVPPSTYVEIANRIGDRWISDSDEYKIARNRHTDPLYWMPLPQPPKEG